MLKTPFLPPPFVPPKWGFFIAVSPKTKTALSPILEFQSEFHRLPNMAWLETRHITPNATAAFDTYLQDLTAKLANENTDRAALCRELLAEFLYGTTYTDLETRLPWVALNLDPNNILLEAEHYHVLDVQKFARVKPLLWLWYNFDLSPAAHNMAFGIAFRRILAQHVFKCCGENIKIFPGVQFSVGYNLSVADDVVIHRNVFIDDIGGVTLHNHVSISDYANIYSHTHSPLESSDVTLKHTTIGAGARITYHSTILAGSTISDDAIVGTMSVVTKDIEPHAIAYGIPAKPMREKIRPPMPTFIDSRIFIRPRDQQANPEYPMPNTNNHTRAVRTLVSR
jgi:acetyltransferase-like isoleucine patch superfamily enzyme